METANVVDFLMNKESSSDDARIQQEPEKFEDDEESVEWPSDLEMVDEGVPAIKDVPPPIENSPAIEKLLPTSVKEELVDELANNEDVLEMNVAMPAGYDEHPVCKGILMNCKITLANEQVVFKPSSMPQDLPNLQIGYTSPLSSFYELAHRIFTYTKVRKKVYHSETAMQQCTKDFHHFFGHSQSLSLHVLLDHSPDISYHLRLPGGILELVMSFLQWNGYKLPFASVYWPAHHIFIYTKVRKRIII